METDDDEEEIEDTQVFEDEEEEGNNEDTVGVAACVLFSVPVFVFVVVAVARTLAWQTAFDSPVSALGVRTGLSVPVGDAPTVLTTASPFSPALLGAPTALVVDEGGL